MAYKKNIFNIGDNVSIWKALEVGENIKALGQITVEGKTVTFSATPTFDLDEGNVQEMTITANVTSLAISNELPSGSYRIFLKQGGAGGYTIAEPGVTFGTRTDNSVVGFVTAVGDVNIIDIAINPNGDTYYSIETITA